MNLAFGKNEIRYFSMYFTKNISWGRDWDLPKLQAHRGFCQGGAIENTLESLTQAKVMGYQMAEFDVQVTKDGVPVLFHDRDLVRLFHKNVLLEEINYFDLKKIAPVSRLLDVMLSSDRPRYLNIEIKSVHLKNLELVQKILEVIKNTQKESEVIISSFNPWVLLQVKRVMPQIPRAMLITDEANIYNLSYIQKLYLAPLVEPQLLHFKETLYDENFISFFKKFDVKLVAWTVNNKDRIHQLKKLGVDSFITDKVVPADFEQY